MAYREANGGDPYRPHHAWVDEPDFARAIAPPAAVAALLILIVSVVLDDNTDDSPWTTGGAAVAICALVLAGAMGTSFWLARQAGMTRGEAAFAAFMVLVATPVVVLAGYVALAALGA